MQENTQIHQITDLILSVDSYQWYYGRRCNVNNEDKKLLVKTYLPTGSTKLDAHLTHINEHFLWMQRRERDTAKRKKRVFYIDRELLKSEDFKFD